MIFFKKKKFEFPHQPRISQFMYTRHVGEKYIIRWQLYLAWVTKQVLET